MRKVYRAGTIRKVYAIVLTVMRGVTVTLAMGLPGAAASACDPIPRTILALYDGDREGAAQDTRIHRFAAMPLNHLGYRLDYVDVSAGDVSRASEGLAGQGVAAILSWFSSSTLPRPDWAGWIDAYRDPCGVRPKRIVLGVPGPPGADVDDLPGRTATIGIEARIAQRDPDVMAGEVPFALRPGVLSGVRAEDPSDSLLRIETTDGPLDLVTVSDRGGFAHDNALVASDPRGGMFWLIDPFAFFGRALATGAWPVPDTTTRNGLRLYLSTVDGRGWTDPLRGQGTGATARLSGQDALETFIIPHPDLPVTVALDMGGLDPAANPGLAAGLASDARGLADLPNARLAAFRDGRDGGVVTQTDGPPISMILQGGDGPGDRAYDVPVMRTALWSPDLLAPSILGLPPLTVPAGASNDVLAPMSVTAPHPAYLAMESILSRTDAPRRLAPFHLSYGVDMTDDAARLATAAYLDMAATGPFAPIQTRDYVAQVEGWQKTRVVPLGQQSWRIEDRGSLDTLRVDAAAGRVLDMDRSRGTLGARRHGQALYIALDPAVEDPVVALADGAAPMGLATPPVAPVLSWAHGRVRQMRRTGCTTEVRLESGGATAWATAPGAVVEVTIERDGDRPRADRIVADETGVAKHDGAGTRPDTVMRLSAPCGTD